MFIRNIGSHVLFTFLIRFIPRQHEFFSFQPIVEPVLFIAAAPTRLSLKESAFLSQADRMIK